MPKTITLSNSDLKRVNFYLRRNVDGIHTESRYLGYVTAHPFTVFAKMIGSYCISIYDGHLVHEQMFTKEECTLEIEIRPIQNEVYYSYNKFIQEYKVELQKCRVTDDNRDEYIRLLGVSKEKEPVVQKAIDCIDLVTATEKVSIYSVSKLIPSSDGLFLDKDVILLYSDIIADYADKKELNKIY